MLNRSHNIEMPSKIDNKKIEISKIKKQIPIKSAHTSGIMFDPIASTPPSDFINALKTRMDVYFSQNVM